MREVLNEMLKELEGQQVSVSEIGLQDEFVVGELHSSLINNYIVIEDESNEDQHIPRIPIEKVTSIVNDLGEWILKTEFGVDFIFSIF